MSQREHKKPILERASRVVIKIGSQILSSPEGIEEKRIEGLVRDLAALHGQNKELIIVSSGAVAAGLTRLGLRERPKTIPQKQALAAVGQISLMAIYEKCFSRFQKNVAQLLLTHEDLANRRRYINARHTLQTLLESSIIPVFN
jgi:glutamate 5-kinase